MVNSNYTYIATIVELVQPVNYFILFFNKFHQLIIEFISFIIEQKIDWVALSFVRKPDDIRHLRSILLEKNSNAKIIAKIEKPEAITHLREIILATDDTMGMVASAQLSEKVMQTFRPRCLLMGGIAAGIQGKSNLGDILVAASSWNYDSGKYLGDGQLNEFLPDFQPINISVEVNRAAKINIDTQLFEIKKKFAPDYVTTDLNVIVGPVASGSAVISDSSIIRRAQSSTRKLIGIEMEIYGMYYAAMHTSAPRPIFLASKSVCDFADETKNDNYQKYASQTSAAYLKYLIDNSVLQ